MKKHENKLRAVLEAKKKLEDSNKDYSVGYTKSGKDGYALELRINVSREDFDAQKFPVNYPTAFEGFPVNVTFVPPGEFC